MNKRNSLVAGSTGRPAALSRWLPLLAVAALVAVAGCESPEERVANYVASAEQFFEAENLVKAELEAKNALQIEPKNADARYLLARIADTKRDFRNVVGNLLIAIESRPEFVEARSKLGTVYVQAGELDLAEEQLLELEKLAPEHTETHLLRARWLANKGELEQAAVELRTAIRLEPENITARGLLASLTAATDVDEALVIVDEAIASTDDNSDLRLLKINILMQAARSDDVDAAYRSLISNFPDENVYRFMFAQFLADQGKIEEVGDVLRAAIANDPSDQDAKLALVELVANTEGGEQGVALLEEFLEEDPTATDLRVLLANQYVNSGDNQSAIAEFQKVADAEGNEDAGLNARIRIAAINISEGDIEAGAAIVDDVLALDPLNANANYLHGLLNFQDGDWKGAVSDLRSALREKPDDVRAQWMLARTHFRAGDTVLAEDAYRRLLKISPLNVAASLELARLMVDQQKLDKAEEFLAEQIGTMPAEVPLSRALIGIMIERGRFDEARAEAQRLSGIPGNEAIGAFFLGSIYQANSQHAEAEESFRAALEERPDAREPLQGLVASLDAQGKIGEARDYLEGLSQQFPKNLFIKTLLGRVMAVSGDQGGAKELLESTLSDNSDWLPAYAALAGLESNNPEAQMDLYRRGLEASPGNTQMALLLGSAYEQNGEIEKAIATYEKAISDNPDSPIVANNLAALLSDYRQDRASFERALELAIAFEVSTQPEFLDTLGWVYYRLGEYEKAEDLLERAVEGNPDIIVQHYHLGMSYLAQDKRQLALQELRIATESPDVFYQGRDEAEQALAELQGTN